MIQTIIKKILKRRHFWRDAGFDELSELYVSMTFRSIAVGSIGIFVPVYMYRLGYTLAEILTLYGWFATTMAIASVGSAWMVARFGPKHVMLLSYALQLCSSALFLTHERVHWPIIVLGIFWGLATNLFFVAYHVDFSKVKHANHSGEEVGYMYMMQKVGLVIGPLLGGVIGTIFGGSYVFLAATLLMALGALPLLKTAEPTRTRQHLDFSIPVHKIRTDMQSYAALATEDILTKMLWPTYIVLFVIVSGVYLKLGLLSSISVLFSIVVTYIFGKIADARRGRHLLRIAVSLNSLLHLMRSFVTSLPQVLGINVANDSITVGYALPFTKGLYAAADEHPGRRIAYIAIVETAGNTARALACWVLVILAVLLEERLVLTIGFAVAAVASLLIAREKFRALDTHEL